MFKKKLFKHALPLILSVAMVFQSMPATALAAESAETEETVIEETTDVVVDDTDESGDDTAADDSASEETTAAAETQTTEESAAAETQTTEESAAAETTSAEEAEETDTEVVEDVAEAALDTKLELRYPLGELFEGFCSGNVVYNNYDAGDTDPFVWEKGEILDNTVVKVDGTEVSGLSDQLTTKWQAKGAEGYADMAAGTVPVNAGEYKLVVTLPKIEGTCNEASLEVNFEIRKARIDVSTAGVNTSVAPGTKVSEVAKSVEDSYTIEDEYSNGLDKAVYVSKATVNVKNSIDNQILEADTELLKTGDYSIVMSIELAEEYAKNYYVSEIPAVDIKMSTAPETQVEITILNSKAFTKTYDGNKVAEPVLGTDYNYDVVITGQVDAEGNPLTVAKDRLTDKITFAWLAEDNETELEEAPIDAGTYYYEIRYAGEDGLYAESKAQVEVEIEPADIYIKPVLKTDKTFYAGMTAKDILDEVDYEVYESADDSKPKDIDRETFWGVSYNNTAIGQSFEPVFKLQAAYAEQGEDGTYSFPKDADGKVVYTYEDVSSSDVLLSPEQAVYRVVFAGTKAAYYANGSVMITVDINRTETSAAETNYEVDVKDETITKNAVSVDVKAVDKAKIDVSALYKLFDGAKENAGESLENPNIKTYDQAALYDLRDDYKKAVVTAEADGKELAKNNDASITYTWQRVSRYETSYDEEGNEIKTPVWYSVSSLNGKGIYVAEDAHTYYAPYTAGEYRLVVSYSTDDCVADDAYVYYTIEKQRVAAVPSGEFTQPYEGTSIADFRDRLNDELEHGVYKIDEYVAGKNNAVEEKDLLPWVEDDDSDDDYDITWAVEHALKDADGNLTGGYEDVSYGTFVEGETYRLGLRISWISSRYGANYRYYDDVISESGSNRVYYTQYLAQEIKPVKMGENQLSFAVDVTKLNTTSKVYDGAPFDISGDISNGFIKFSATNTSGETKELTAEEVEALGVEYWWECAEYSDWTEEAVNGGQYNLYVQFTGNDTYAPINNLVTDANGDEVVFTITQREITAAPVLVEPITAGNNASTVFERVGNNAVCLAFDGDILESDKDAFLYNDDYYYDYGYKAVNYCYGSVLQGVDEVSDYSRLRSGQEYKACLPELYLSEPYNRNYNLTRTAISFTPVRGQSTVIKSGYKYNIKGTALKAAVDTSDADNFTYTITPREGIPFSYDGLYIEKLEKYVPGNYFAFRIKAPKEFSTSTDYNKFIYENSIMQAGGYTYRSSNAIYAVFDASAKDEYTFKIRWADNYVETFVVDLKNAVLEDNMKEAVAPKSISFNNPIKKMVVGGTQQLDVKVTKVQLNDIICLDYAVDDTKVLSVTDSGYLTALSKGSATVTVIPSYLNDDGEKVAIKGAKTASVKITVADVTAPKIKSVTAHDTYADVVYPAVNDGYRREIYVLEGKNVKVDTFETAISSVKNGAWEGVFAIAPRYVANNPAYVRISGLKVNTEYTVYVRNVSGIRTLADGTQVVSSKAGSVKSFKTTLAQVDELVAYFNTVDGPVYINDDYEYTVKFSDKSAQLKVEGFYPEININQSADEGDQIVYQLPLTSDQKKNYVDPKLAYYALESDEAYRGDAKDAKKDGYTIEIDGKYYKPSKIATIDKKGKVSFKGVGWVSIYVYDTVSGCDCWQYLYITATTDSIKAKNIKLKVGETAWLSNYLTFSEKGKKLAGDIPYYLYIENAAALSNDYFTVQRVDNDYMIVAKKPGGTLNIKVSDLFAGGASTSVKVQSAAIDAVKNVKADEVRDTFFTLKFNYSAFSAYSEYNGEYPWDNPGKLFTTIDEIDKAGFRIEVRDSRNKLIKDKFISLTEEYDGVDFWVENIDSKGVATFAYYIDGLTRLSSYKVSVTAVFGTEKSKVASKTVKTTNIPASYEDMNAEWNVGQDGGMAINIGDTYLGEYYALVSNNTYTLIAWPDNNEARNRLTDTLTWKSTNTKVATVKANAGSYTATLKALHKGTTQIEVTSKITKKVIARWTVFVNATGEAGSLYGDLEPEEGEEYNRTYDETNMEVLTIANPVSAVLGSNEVKWVVFKAPEYGKYYIKSRSWVSAYANNGYLITGFYGNEFKLDKGETIYICMRNATNTSDTNTLTVSQCTMYSELKLDDSIEVKGYKYIVFEAPETDTYVFSADKEGVTINGNAAPYNVMLTKGEKYEFQAYSGSVCNISVKRYNAEDVTTQALAAQSIITEAWGIAN